MGRGAAGRAIARLVALYCERPGSRTQRELCEELNLTARQVRRHMAELRAEGLPVSREYEPPGPVHWTLWIRLRASAPSAVVVRRRRRRR